MKTILLVDDDEQLLWVLGKTLIDEGYEVLSTADGPQALAIAESRKPDLVLLDVGLPTMNGIEVLQRIRQIDSRIRVMIVSAYSSEATLNAAIDAGAVQFLEKPIDVDRLLAIVRHVLSRSDDTTANP